MGELSEWNIITLSNTDTDLKYFENVHKILLDGKCDTMNILFQADIFGAVFTDKTYADGYYVFIYK